jgi:hypothetical protein
MPKKKIIEENRSKSELNEQNSDEDNSSEDNSCDSNLCNEYEQPKSYEELIYSIRKKLAEKASAKRLIEKANRTYVDLNFQKTSIQLTAQLYQKVQQEESAIDKQINDLNNKVDELQNRMYQEFGEIRTLINEVAKVREEIVAQRQAYPHTRGYRGHRKSSSFVPLLKRELRNIPKKKNAHIASVKQPKEKTFTYVLSKYPIPPLYPSQNITSQIQGKIENAIHFDPMFSK